MEYSYIYILSNENRTVFYTGVTADLSKRILEHRSGKGSAFCQRYNVYILVYFELFIDINTAIAREKQIKNWRREWKVNLIESKNPEMKDLMEKRKYKP
jgi:putative endonuclease